MQKRPLNCIFSIDIKWKKMLSAKTPNNVEFSQICSQKCGLKFKSLKHMMKKYTKSKSVHFI